MKKSHLMGAVCACVFTFLASTSQAVSLQNGDVLSFTAFEGSIVSGVAAGGTFDNAPLDANDGIVIGTTQGGVPGIDETWTSGIVGIMGNHFTTSDVNVLSGATLDFSGWVLFLGGSNYELGVTQGIANYTFDGINFTLDYSWNYINDNGGNPLGNLSVTDYVLHLEGTVVPIPAAAWLFGSGLLCLVGMARRKKAA